MDKQRILFEAVGDLIANATDLGEHIHPETGEVSADWLAVIDAWNALDKPTPDDFTYEFQWSHGVTASQIRKMTATDKRGRVEKIIRWDDNRGAIIHRLLADKDPDAHMHRVPLVHLPALVAEIERERAALAKTQSEAVAAAQELFSDSD